jgi:ribosomal protein L37AE/L43A
MDNTTAAAAQKITCPNCGATDIIFHTVKGMFHCQYCGSDSLPNAEGALSIITTLNNAKALKGHHLSPGMGDLHIPDQGVVSFRCPNCKAEMSIEARSNIGSLVCHWCRHVISVANIIANGPRPDAIIPFTVPKDYAEALIRNHISQFRFFANRKFAKTFRPEMIKPVFLPYAMCDFHLRATHAGEAAIHRGSHLVMPPMGKSYTCYDLDLYGFMRRFHLYINDLLVEANRKYVRNRGQRTTVHSRNIVNSILPFDTSKIVDYDPKFLNGEYRAEFRDLTFDDMRMNIKNQFEDIAAYNTHQFMQQYDGGYKVLNTTLDFVGDRIDSVLCPIWLYSYRDRRRQLHYICVNGQTGELAASIPINKLMFFFFSFVLTYILPAVMMTNYCSYVLAKDVEKGAFLFAFIMSALIFCPMIYGLLYKFFFEKIKKKYTGEDQRHEHERLTQNTFDGLEAEDHFLRRFDTIVKNFRMGGERTYSNMHVEQCLASFSSMEDFHAYKAAGGYVSPLLDLIYGK